MKTCTFCKNEITTQTYNNAGDYCDNCCKIISENKCLDCGGNLRDYRFPRKNAEGREIWVPRKGCRPCNNVYPYITR